MKVRFLKDCHGTHGNFAAGQVVDIAEAVAVAWGRAGVIEHVAPEPPVKVPDMVPETTKVDKGEKAVKRPGRPRKVS